MDRMRQQDRLRAVIANVFVTVRVSSLRVTGILHEGELLCTRCFPNLRCGTGAEMSSDWRKWSESATTVPETRTAQHPSPIVSVSWSDGVRCSGPDRRNPQNSRFRRSSLPIESRSPPRNFYSGSVTGYTKLSPKNTRYSCAL